MASVLVTFADAHTRVFRIHIFYVTKNGGFLSCSMSSLYPTYVTLVDAHPGRANVTSADANSLG